MKEIYLDLDGVCVDFISSAIAANGFHSDSVLARWEAEHKGEFFPDKVLDMEMEAFWSQLDELGESFWVNLEPYPWFDELYRRLGEVGHVVFCTSSTYSPSCLSGKLHWLQARFGTDFDEYILTAHKDRLAHGQAFLVDDYDVNVQRFNERGGNGVLFPQFWNANHGYTGDPLDYVIETIVGRSAVRPVPLWNE